jgi:zinc protease
MTKHESIKNNEVRAASGDCGLTYPSFGFRHCFGFRIGKPGRSFTRVTADFVIPAALIMFVMITSAFAIGGLDRPPPPAAPPETHFSQPKEAKLDNGLRVIVAERPELPLVAVQLMVVSGAEADPPDFAGAASMTGSLLSKGTEKMSAPQIAEAIESLGGDISSGASWDSSNASLLITSDKLDPALTILADIVLHPAFQQEEIERVRKQRLDGLRVAMQQPGSVAGYVAERAVFGAGEYGHAAGGTIESISKMQRQNLVDYYKKHYAPDKGAFILVGDITMDRAKAYAQKFFGDWKAEDQSPDQSAPALSDWKPRNVVIDMPEAGQACVGTAKPAVKRDSPDYYAGIVANAALGSGFVSRLNREIRIKRGLSYGAHSSLEARRDVGPFTAMAQTKNESAAEVAKLLIGEIKRLVDDPVKGEELKSRQALLTGGYARSLETNEGFAEKLSTYAAYGLPLDTLNQFTPKVNAVTTDDITAFAKKYFGTPSLIITGKASAFVDALKKDFTDVQVIAQKDLDLNTPALVKTAAGQPSAAGDR